MRKLSAGLSITLDGIVDGEPEWVGAHFSPEFAQTIRDLQAAGDTMLLGRVTYEYFQEAFGGGDGPEADYLNNVRKIVVSRTLKTADWQNSTVVSKNLADEVAKLKRERSKKNINVSGSISIVQWLLKHGLVDELHLIVFPVVQVTGRRLFEELNKKPINFTLADSQPLPQGVMHLTYQIA
ncbi:MAG: dihydrofolate reductase family protein [Jatrophihabitantaceae bacterium]